MKVESIHIQNFKRFDDLEVSFKNDILDEISDRYLILGDNGSGKTTLLQAIALPLALATRQIRTVKDFSWTGFLPQRYQRWGTPRIELQVSFTRSELESTQEVARQWRDTQPYLENFVEPGDSETVTLVLDGESFYAGSAPDLFQFAGRFYARRLLETNPSIRSYFSQLPGIFWFDQFRNLASKPPEINEGANGLSDNRVQGGRVSEYEQGVGTLRQYLNGWKIGQITHTYSVDYLSNLENLYKKIFPDRSFGELEPIPGVEAPTPKDYFFLIDDGHRQYDVSEMSAGEQSVFAILYRFVQLQITYSVVLIDEIDLNLHPSAAQFLTAQLPKVSQTCQFIFTTHSSAVSNIIGESETFRLPGGALCL